METPNLAQKYGDKARRLDHNQAMKFHIHNLRFIPHDVQVE